ncbi:MAG: carbohydrate ABC transporter permease [Eubacteriales bacterium]|nr:carbohydrate ABC transporter permease [Eubacteriales bacterium]
MKRRAMISKTLTHSALILLSLLFFFPLYWMIITSLKPNSEILKLPLRFFVTNPTLENFTRTFEDGLFVIYYKNNIIVSALTTLVTIFLATMASYAFSRYKFKGSGALQMLILSTQMFPAVVLLISLYTMYSKLKLLNTYAALILACSTNALPMSIWMLKSFFDTVPSSLEESASLDGASKGYTLVKIIIPLVKPGILAVGLYSFLLSWEDFLWGLNLVTKIDMRTLASGISLSYLGESAYDWGKAISATVAAALPVMIAFIFLQKNFIAGLTAGAVKG